MINFSRPTIDLIRQTFSENTYTDSFPKAILDLIYDHKLFKIFVPTQLGGLECSLPEGLKILELSAYIDGDFGWAVQIGAGGGYFTGFLQPEVASRYVAEPEFVIAGSGVPGGEAKLSGDEFKVSGKWKYCSGSHYATLFTANCVLDGSDDIKAFAFDPSQVSIENDWEAYGMQSTLSHSIIVNDSSVNKHMIFSSDKLINDYGYSIYHFPFMEFARTCIVSVMIGCFNHLLNEANNFFHSGKFTLERHEALEKLLTSIEIENGQHAEKFESSVKQAWDKVDSDSLADQLSELNQVIDQYMSFINTQSFTLFNLVGMEATASNSSFNKIWRDLTTAAQHILMKTYH